MSKPPPGGPPAPGPPAAGGFPPCGAGAAAVAAGAPGAPGPPVPLAALIFMNSPGGRLSVRSFCPTGGSAGAAGSTCASRRHHLHELRGDALERRVLVHDDRERLLGLQVADLDFAGRGVNARDRAADRAERARDQFIGREMRAVLALV